MAVPSRPPHWTAPERIAFYLFSVLIFAPFLAWVIEWRIHISNVRFDEVCGGSHLLGIVGMLGWCVFYLRSDPRFARVGLVVTLLLVVGWAYILLI